MVVAVCAAGGLIAFMYRRSIKPQYMKVIKGVIGVTLLATFNIGTMSWIHMTEKARDITWDAADHERE